MLPEFFTAGVAYRVQLGQAAQTLRGWVTQAGTDWAVPNDLEPATVGARLPRQREGQLADGRGVQDRGADQPGEQTGCLPSR